MRDVMRYTSQPCCDAGQTGSFLGMAPEVTLGQQYNEKVTSMGEGDFPLPLHTCCCL